MKKKVVINGKQRELTSLYPVMLTDSDGNNRTCRTIHEDEDGTLWVMWNHEYRNVEKVDGFSLPEGRRSKEAYIVL